VIGPPDWGGRASEPGKGSGGGVGRNTSGPLMQARDLRGAEKKTKSAQPKTGDQQKKTSQLKQTKSGRSWGMASSRHGAWCHIPRGRRGWRRKRMQSKLSSWGAQRKPRKAGYGVPGHKTKDKSTPALKRETVYMLSPEWWVGKKAHKVTLRPRNNPKDHLPS